MNEIFEIAGAVIISFGGAGVIILGLSNWLGKVWANKILEKEKAEHSKEIEDYKSRLELELQKYNYINDRANHISKKQYEKEFQFYMEIWESLVELSNKTLNLFPISENVPADNEELKKFKLSKYDDFGKAYNSYLLLSKRYLPFYNEEISKVFIEFRELCYEQGISYETYVAEPLINHNEDWMFDLSKEDAKKTKREIPKKIQEFEKKIAVAIREYLYSLQKIY